MVLGIYWCRCRLENLASSWILSLPKKEATSRLIDTEGTILLLVISSILPRYCGIHWNCIQKLKLASVYTGLPLLGSSNSPDLNSVDCFFPSCSVGNIWHHQQLHTQSKGRKCIIHLQHAVQGKCFQWGIICWKISSMQKKSQCRWILGWYSENKNQRKQDYYLKLCQVQILRHKSQSFSTQNLQLPS